MTLTKLSLKNMVFYGHHGVYQAEKELGQRIEVDVEVVGDFIKAGKSDDFTETTNYVLIYQIAREIVEEGKYNLVEAIATAIMDRITGRCQFEIVTVRVRKPQPPVGGPMDAVEVEITNQK